MGCNINQYLHAHVGTDNHLSPHARVSFEGGTENFLSLRAWGAIPFNLWAHVETDNHLSPHTRVSFEGGTENFLSLRACRVISFNLHAHVGTDNHLSPLARVVRAGQKVFCPYAPNPTTHNATHHTAPAQPTPIVFLHRSIQSSHL